LPPIAFLPGYLIYLLFIFVPGVGFGELFGILKKINQLSEKLAVAFALGISIDTVVMLIKTSSVAGLVGIDLTTVYFVIATGLVALLVSLALNKWKFGLFAKPTSVDLALFLIILIQGTILLLYFQKYPIFPQYQSQDFGNHVNYVQGLISGSITSIPQGLLYFGVHYQLASSLLLVGGEPLVTLQRTMALLITISPLAFYYAAKRIFSDARVGLITAMIYVVSGTIWYTGPLDAGLYPNFFGILAALFLLTSLTFIIDNPKSLANWIFFLLTLINGYMSHYTFVTLLPAILLLPILQYASIVAKSRKLYQSGVIKPLMLSYIAPAVITIIPVAIPFIAYPSVGKYVIFLATNGGGIVTGNTSLSAFLSIAFLKYLAIEVYNDIEFVVLFVLAIFYLYKAIASRSPLLFIPIIWFLALAFVAPSNLSAWRYSYEALVPLVMMASYGVYMLFPNPKSTGRVSLGKRMKVTGGRSPVLTAAIILIAFGALFINAYGQLVVADSLSSTAIVYKTQDEVYTTIYWLKDNTPANSSYVSVSDWRFTYTSTMIGRGTYYSYIYSPALALSVAKNISAQYIIVTKIVTAAVPNSQSLFPWNTFPPASNSNLTLLYNSADVRVYQIINIK